MQYSQLWDYLTVDERICVTLLSTIPVFIPQHSLHSSSFVLSIPCMLDWLPFSSLVKELYTWIRHEKCIMMGIEGYFPIAFSSLRAQPEVALFWCQMKAHILIITPKSQLQIRYTLEVIAENAPISGVPFWIFLCIFITASPPVSHTYFCPRREN